MRYLLILIALVASLHAESLYVTETGAGAQNGLSLATAWSAANFNTSGNWGSGAGKISAGDTVYLSGVFTTRLTVLGSGSSSSNRITLTRSYLEAPGVTTLVGIQSVGYDYIAVLNLEFTQFSSANNYMCIRLDSGCDGWLVQDNYMHDTYGGGIDLHTTACNDCIIRCNRFNNIAWIDRGASNANTITVTGSRNLVEYNIIGNSLDRVYLGSGSGNVVRNNSYTYSDAALYTGTSTFPFHRDDLQGGVQSSPPVSQFLIERNYSIDNLESIGGNAHNVILQNYDTAGEMAWIVLRFNAVIRTGGAFILQAADSVYGYNQTLITTEIYQDSSHITNAFYYGGSVTGDKSDWRNNTWSLSPYYYQTGGGIFATTDVRFPTNFTSGYQHSWYTGTSGGLLPAAGTNLGHVDPLFTNSSIDDYTLQSGSPLRGAGGPITTASGSGTGSTSLTVVDAHPIFDGLTASGWPSADADWIKIGSGAYVQVASINYGTNVITLTAARTWSNGDSVIVKGMEDIGALPYSYAITPTVSLNNVYLEVGPNDLTAAVNDVNCVRKVEFIVDGIPIGTSYESPYSTNYTSDGAVHQVEARAYSQWANATPTASDTKLLGRSAAGSGQPGTNVLQIAP
jgi:hypothetical protein